MQNKTVAKKKYNNYNNNTNEKKKLYNEHKHKYAQFHIT